VLVAGGFAAAARESHVRPLQPLLGNNQQVRSQALISGVIGHLKAFRCGKTILLFLLLGQLRSPGGLGAPGGT
jgi:hypothetical protein